MSDDDLDDEDFFAREAARQALAKEALAALIERARPAGAAELISTISGDARAAVVTRDPSRPEGWRVTRFDVDGPSGHTECGSLESAIKEAWAQGFRAWAPGAVDALIGLAAERI